MFDWHTNTNKIAGIALAVMLAAGMIAAAGAGSVAATDQDATILVHNETAIDNSTDSVYADVTGASNMDANGPIAVNVTVEGLTEGTDPGNGTVLQQTQLSVSAGNLSSFTYELTDTETTDYDSVYLEVNVVTDGYSDYVASVDHGVLAEVTGGGGGTLSGDVAGIPIVGALAALAFGWFIVGRD